MANKQLFNTKTASIPTATTKNRAGGKAYELTAMDSLAQYAATGMLGTTYYANAQEHLDTVLDLARAVSPKFLAQVAVYSRRQAWLKDMPALLLAVLATRDTVLFKQTFPQVCDNARMVRNFVQIIRSGVVGRKSLGSAPKRALQEWFRNSTDEYIFKSSVGNNPSLVDVIKLVHPRPENKSREALYRYLLGKEMKGYRRSLPAIVKEFEKFKKQSPAKRTVPDVPFQMLTSLDLSTEEWTEIAKNGGWQFTRMNLNTFQRHGVFDSQEMKLLISMRLRDEALVLKSRNYPFQLFQSYRNTTDVPDSIRNALQDAVDISLKNIPTYGTGVHVLIDVSGSMHAPVTGGSWQYGYHNRGVGPVTCVEAASLFGAGILAKNVDAQIVAFTTVAKKVALNSRDSLVTNTKKIADSLSGGTDCSSGLKFLNQQNAKGDLVVMLSDNESWASAGGKSTWWGRSSGTNMMSEWKAYKKRNPKAVLVCVDIVPSTTAQAVGQDVLFVGGFNDRVFDVIGSFLESRGDHTYWTKKIASARN